MLLNIPNNTPLKHMLEFAVSQGCCLKSNTNGGFDFVPSKKKPEQPVKVAFFKPNNSEFHRF